MLKKKAKIGDKVRVIKDLEGDRSYIRIGNEYPLSSHLTLCDYANKVGEVYYIDEDGDYQLELDGKKLDGWYFSDGMLEEVKEDKKPSDFEVMDNLYLKLESAIRVTKFIHNNPATIMFYRLEGESKVRKVVARCEKGDTYDKMEGKEVCMLKAMIKEAQRELNRY